MNPLRLLLGRRLANREYGERKIGAFEGVPAMGLDGLGSSAYGPEAALTVLIPLGGASLTYIGWVMAPIVGLLAILFISYWQTLKAYPNNGGAYIVAKENLGTNASLLAAAALMVDYVLNVAVGISAGVAALISALPALHPYILPICLAILLMITIVNLRGTLDAGRLFALPTYLFVASFTAIIGIGIYKLLTAGGHPDPVIAPPPLSAGTEAATAWLLLRAFAAGCTAMTGVEAVSNGMSAFRDPAVRHGHRTLAAIVTVLGLLLAGIAWLATAYGIGAMDQAREGYRSVLSQLAAAVIGNGVLYFVAMASLLCVLALSANTSFVDFPRLCRMAAEDGFLPEPFAIAGRRLVFSVGVLYLMAAAGLLLTVFGGITDHLIPLFAVGAFMTFTLSQAGMAVHWQRRRRRREPGQGKRSDHAHFWINTIGAIATGTALLVILAAKFTEGGWITAVVIPLVIVLLKSIRRYYDRLEASVRDTDPLQVEGIAPPVVLVAVKEWDRLTEKALRLALSLSSDVFAIHLTHLSGPEAEEHDRALQARWHTKVDTALAGTGFAIPRLVVLQAEYRSIHEPVLAFASDIGARAGGRQVAVLIPEVVKRHWYQHLLHARHARHLRSQLLRHAGGRLTVISVPWQFEAAEP